MCKGKICVIKPEIVTEHHRREETTEFLIKTLWKCFLSRMIWRTLSQSSLLSHKSEGTPERAITGQPHCLFTATSRKEQIQHRGLPAQRAFPDRLLQSKDRLLATIVTWPSWHNDSPCPHYPQTMQKLRFKSKRQTFIPKS